MELVYSSRMYFESLRSCLQPTHRLPAGAAWTNPGDPCVALDVETTGTSHERDRILSLGLCNTESLDTAHWILDPKGIESSPAALKTHGITEERIQAEGVEFAEIWPDIEEFCQGYPLIAHNAKFDFRFLKSTLDRENIICSRNFHRSNWTDTLKVARLCMPEKVSHTLDRLVQHLELEISHREIHDAGEDTRILAQCWNSEILQSRWQEVPDKKKPLCNLERILPA